MTHSVLSLQAQLSPSVLLFPSLWRVCAGGGVGGALLVCAVSLCECVDLCGLPLLSPPCSARGTTRSLPRRFLLLQCAATLTPATGGLPEQEQIEVSRYVHVPVGNASSDWTLHAMDVQYGRCLREARHLLWAVDPRVPDVAGGDGDARRIDELLDLEQEPLEVIVDCSCGTR